MCAFFGWFSNLLKMGKLFRVLPGQIDTEEERERQSVCDKRKRVRERQSVCVKERGKVCV